MRKYEALKATVAVALASSIGLSAVAGASTVKKQEKLTPYQIEVNQYNRFVARLLKEHLPWKFDKQTNTRQAISTQPNGDEVQFSLFKDVNDNGTMIALYHKGTRFPAGKQPTQLPFDMILLNTNIDTHNNTENPAFDGYVVNTNYHILKSLTLDVDGNRVHQDHANVTNTISYQEALQRVAFMEAQGTQAANDAVHHINIPSTWPNVNIKP